MTPTRQRSACILLLAWISAGCGLLPTGQTPSPAPTTGPSAGVSGMVEVVFRAVPPAGTADDAGLVLQVMDPVTGFAYNSQSHPLQPIGDGIWQGSLSVLPGSVVSYRYARTFPASTDEYTTTGDPVSFRLAYVNGDTLVEDVIAAWQETPFSGSTGRLVGKLTDAATGRGLIEMQVSAGGKRAFTDGEGAFRLDGLPPGLHTLVITSLDGAYRPVQQGAIIAAESATPADLALEAAEPIQMVFEVTLPEGTPTDQPLRLAGNTLQLGHTFTDLEGGVRNPAAASPVMVQVDPTHALLIVSLYGGMDLHYKYTLGDGLWSAERTPAAAFYTRQVVLPEQDTTLTDTVSRWQSGGKGPLIFRLAVPESTPPSEQVSLQLNPFTWFEPLPMVRVGPGQWSLSVLGPLDFDFPLAYRYCRNLQCESAAETPPSEASARQVLPTEGPQERSDTVARWAWYPAPPAEVTVVAPEIAVRADLQAGVEFAPTYDPSWAAVMPQALADLAGIGSNAVIFTPAWAMQDAAPTPVLGFEPGIGPFQSEVKGAVAEANRLGMQAILHPALRSPGGDYAGWWAAAPRDGAWWTVWFEMYRSFLLTYAHLAAEAGASKLVLGGPEVAPALPAGRLPDGTPSGAPADAEERWRALIADVRSVYPGRLAFEIELGRSLQSPPGFLEAVDEVHVYFHPSLGPTPGMSPEQMAATVKSLVDDSLLSTPAFSGKPLVLSVEYLSVSGGATSCVPGGGTCLPASAFDAGAEGNTAVGVDLDEQSNAINAVLLDVYSRPEITGFFTRRYDPTAALQDKSASVNGKPARDVLWYWYSRMLSR
jgi:hypothetical protein